MEFPYDPPATTTITIGEKTANIPHHWNDLSNRQLLEIFAIIIATGQESRQLIPSGETARYNRLHIFTALMGVTPKEMTEWYGDCVAAFDAEDDLPEGEEPLTGKDVFYSELLTCLEAMTFCYEEVDQGEDEPPPLRIKLELTRNPFPIMEGGRSKREGKLKYYGPADGLENLDIYELAFFLSAYDTYVESGKSADLDYLIAILWRKKGGEQREGDPRRPFYRREAAAYQRQQQIKRLPQTVKQLLFFFLASCRRQIVEDPAYAILFQPHPALQGAEDPDGWAGTLLHLADEKVMNMDALARQPWQNAFLQLAREKRRAIEEVRRTPA